MHLIEKQEEPKKMQKNKILSEDNRKSCIFASSN